MKENQKQKVAKKIILKRLDAQKRQTRLQIWRSDKRDAEQNDTKKELYKWCA